MDDDSVANQVVTVGPDDPAGQQVEIIGLSHQGGQSVQTTSGTRYRYAVLRSRHFFGRLRLRKSEVPEPTPAPTKLGRLRLQAKKAAPGGSGSIH